MIIQHCVYRCASVLVILDLVKCTTVKCADLLSPLNVAQGGMPSVLYVCGTGQLKCFGGICKLLFTPFAQNRPAFCSHGNFARPLSMTDLNNAWMPIGASYKRKHFNPASFLGRRMKTYRHMFWYPMCLQMVKQGAISKALRHVNSNKVGHIWWKVVRQSLI